METACPHCGKRYKVADDSAGKQARCANPACKKAFTVGAVAPAPARPAQPAAAPVAPQVPAVPDVPAAAMPSGSPLDDLLAAEMGAAPPALPGGPAVPGYPAAPGASPLAPAPGYRRRRSKMPLIVGAAVGGGVLLIGLIVLVVVLAGGGGGSGGGPGGGGSGAASNGLPGWAAFVVPPGAKMIGFADVDKFRQGQLWKLIERLASQSGQVNAMQMMAMQSQIQNARDTFVCLVDKDSPVAVSRVKDDITLEAAAQASGALPGKPAPSGPAPSSPPKTHAGVAYMSFSQGFVAKVAPSTFCTAKREQDLQAALDRLQRKEAVALSPELQLAFKSKNGDHYLAMTDLSSFGNPMPSRPGSMPDPKWIAAGISGNATVQVDVTIGFASAADAGRIKAEFDGAMQKADQELGKLPPQAPPQIKAVIQKLLGMIHAIRLNQSGDTIRATASWQVKDIEELVNTAQSMGGMGGPGAGPPF